MCLCRIDRETAGRRSRSHSKVHHIAAGRRLFKSRFCFLPFFAWSFCAKFEIYGFSFAVKPLCEPSSQCERVCVCWSTATQSVRNQVIFIRHRFGRQWSTQISSGLTEQMIKTHFLHKPHFVQGKTTDGEQVINAAYSHSVLGALATRL